MQLLTLMTLLGTAALSTAQNVPIVKACTEIRMGGHCTTAGPGQAPLVGSFNSYSWPGGHTGHCAQFCNGCTSLGYACQIQDNPILSFNKAFVYPWKEGSDGAPCC